MDAVALKKACRAQIDAMQNHTELRFPSAQVCQHTYERYRSDNSYMREDWDGLIRQLDRLQPDYKD